MGPGLPAKPLGQLLEILKEGRVSPLLREMHFHTLAEENLLVLSQTLQAWAATETTKGLTRLEGGWFHLQTLDPTTLEAFRHIARLVLPTLEELPRSIDGHATLFSECMKLTPAWSLRRVTAT